MSKSGTVSVGRKRRGRLRNVSTPRGTARRPSVPRNWRTTTQVASPTRPYLSMDLTVDDLKFFQDLMLEMGAIPQPLDVANLIFH